MPRGIKLYTNRSQFYPYVYTWFVFKGDPFKMIFYTCTAEVAYFQGLMDNE